MPRTVTNRVRWALAFLPLATLGAAPADGPNPPPQDPDRSREERAGGLDGRRQELRKSEESVRALRDEVAEQMADVMAIQKIATRKADDKHRKAVLAFEKARSGVGELVPGR